MRIWKIKPIGIFSNENLENNQSKLNVCGLQILFTVVLISFQVFENLRIHLDTL